MEIPDLEVIIPSENPRAFVHLCDPTAVTLPLHSTPLEPSSTHETPARFGTQYVSPVSGHSHCPPVLSPQHFHSPHFTGTLHFFYVRLFYRCDAQHTHYKIMSE